MSEPERQTVWLTRDQDDGVLSDLVTVWDVRPYPFILLEGKFPHRVNCWMVARGNFSGIIDALEWRQCREIYGVTPMTERECIRATLRSYEV